MIIGFSFLGLVEASWEWKHFVQDICWKTGENLSVVGKLFY
jgi:hypothetical protein